MPSGTVQDASGRLKRAKSTSSVPRSIPSNRNAVTAASLAFERAKATQLDSIGGRDAQRIPRRRSTTTNRLSGEGTHLSRRTSRLRSSTDEPRSTTLSGSDAMHDRRRPMTSNGSPKPRSEASNVSVTSPDMHFAKRFDGYGVPANSRLRKTQSCATHSTVTPIQESHTSGLTRRLTVAAPATRENQTDEAILALARDRYLHEHQMTPLRKRSSFFAPFMPKSRKSNRDSMNTDVTVSQDQDSVDLTRPRRSVLEHTSASHGPERSSDPKAATSAPTSRRVSSSFSSIKSSWKRTFGRGSRSSSGTTEMPPQHIVARTQHYGRPGRHGDLNDHVPNAYGTTEVLPPTSPSPPTPPPHLVDVGRPWSREEPISSVAPTNDESAYERSRITSWADSTRQSTLVGVSNDQLPRIEESPESRNTSVLPGQSRDDFRYQGPSLPPRKSSSHFSLRGTVDGKRLFSALMRHKSNSADRSESRAHATLDVVREYTDQLMTGADEGETGEPANAATTDAVGMSGIRRMSLELPYANLSNDLEPQWPRANGSELLSRPEVVSPSVYSERNDSVMRFQAEGNKVRIPTEPGMVTVLTSGAVSKWALGTPTRGHKQSTSNEWRTWIAGETAGIEGRASFSLPAFSAPEPTDNSDTNEDRDRPEPDPTENHDSPASSGRAPSIEATPGTPDWIEGPSAAPRLSGGPPTASTSASRVPSNATSIMSKASHRSSSGIRRVLGIAKVKDERSKIQQDIGQEPSNTDLLSRHMDSPGQHRALQDSRHSGSRIPRFPRKPLPTSVGSSSGSPSRGRELDDNFLLRIRKGPYNTSTNSFARMPTSSRDTLSVSKRSPAASGNENTPPSQGQRMADDFLSKRKARADEGEGSPAFM